MRYKNILLIALAVAIILLIPLIAMQFTDKVAWTGFDFAVAGLLLFGTGLAYELVVSRMSLTEYRAAVGLALGTALLLVWVNIAVGIIGSEDNPANRMYLGVISVFVLGALIVQFRPRGMAGVLFVTALAQIFVTGITLLSEKDLELFEVLVLNGFFVALWAGAAWLFRRADARLSQRIA